MENYHQGVITSNTWCLFKDMHQLSTGIHRFHLKLNRRTYDRLEYKISKNPLGIQLYISQKSRISPFLSNKLKIGMKSKNIGFNTLSFSERYLPYVRNYYKSVEVLRHYRSNKLFQIICITMNILEFRLFIIIGNRHALHSRSTRRTTNTSQYLLSITSTI